MSCGFAETLIRMRRLARSGRAITAVISICHFFVALEMPGGSGARRVSFQLIVLKVLESQPDGRASLADVRRAVAILMTSGRDWSDRTRRLAEPAQELNIFAASYVARDPDGWAITEAGRTFLAAIEASAAIHLERSPEPQSQPTLDEVIAAAETTRPPRSVPDRGPERRRRRRGAKVTGRRR
jgi:hypothetical protein